MHGVALSKVCGVHIQLPGELASMSSKRVCRGIADVRPQPLLPIPHTRTEQSYGGITQYLGGVEY